MAERRSSEGEDCGAEIDGSAAEFGRELSVSKHTIYGWKAKCRGSDGGGSAASMATGGSGRAVEEAGGGFKFGYRRR